MRLRKPDFEKTATGYFWLDWLTAPYWRWVDRRTRRKFLAEGAIVIPEPIVRPLGTPLTYAGVRHVWDAYVKPEQDAEIPPSIEMRCLMAILRAIAQGYVDAGRGPALDAHSSGETL